MGHIIGIDLASEVSSVVAMTKSGRVALNTRVATSEKNLKQLIKSFKAPRQVVFEECGQAAWLYSVLEPVCDDVFVCNPNKNKNLSGHNKSDDNDAYNLAERARLGALSRVWHGGKNLQSLRDRLRDYQVLTQESTATKNRIKAIFRNRGISIGSTAYNPDTRLEASMQLEQVALRDRVIRLGEVLDAITEQRNQALADLLKAARKNEMFKPLKSMPGIGDIFAATIIGEVGTAHRFRTRKQFWSYVGFAITIYETGEYQTDTQGRIRRKDRKVKTRGLVKQCNPTLKYVFKTIAMGLSSSEWSHEFKRLQNQGVCIPNARLTLARKAAAIALHLMKTGEMYDHTLVYSSKK